MIKLGLMPFYGSMNYKVYCIDLRMRYSRCTGFVEIISAGAGSADTKNSGSTEVQPFVSKSVFNMEYRN